MYLWLKKWFTNYAHCLGLNNILWACGRKFCSNRCLCFVGFALEFIIYYVDIYGVNAVKAL